MVSGSEAVPLDPCGVGVDRLSLSFPVRDHAEPARWDKWEHDYARGGYRASTSVRPANGGPGVMVGVQTVAGRTWGKVECNPARFADPDGCSLLPPRDVPAAAVVMLAAAGEVTTLDCDPRDVRVRRVDVARDLHGITRPGLYVRGLAPLRRAYAKRSYLYNDVARGQAETLWVGTKQAGGVRLYDQREAYGAKVEATYGDVGGALRFEVEARRGWLEAVGVRTLHDVDAVTVSRLAEQRWEWAAMGTEVTGPVNMAEVVTAMARRGDVSWAVGERLVGRLVLDALGVERQRAKRTDARYRKLERSAGVVPAEDLWTAALDRQAVGRLDFESGREVLALAG